ncbi:MAG: hypothetical protein ACHQT5_01820 [Candidatus Saccharimonadales bacterium]|jgi:hypothetical protein
MVDTYSVRRLIENEAIFRRHNEKVKDDLEELNELAISEGEVPPVKQSMVLHFYCECSDENCAKRVSVRLDEYTNVHTNKRRFILLPGHEVGMVEKVVKRTPKYLVVEKFLDPPEKPRKLHETSINNV